VRLYRRHFMTLIRIATPPVIVSAIGSMFSTFGWRGVIATTSEERLALYGLMVGVGLTLTVGGMLLNMIVMGGAARNLVTHLLWNEPVTARTTYRNVRARFWGLLGAAIIIGLYVVLMFFVTLFVWLMAYAIVAFGVIAMAQIAVWLGAVVGVIGFLTITLFALALFFFLAGRVVYVPQVMLIEGKGVGQALTRSFQLSRGNVRRLLAMFLFTTFATYSALMILVVPLDWYGSLNGINLSIWSTTTWPTWAAVIYSVLSQLSQILLLPVWMLGLSLLYVDERVRHEGYDIELMAAQQMGAMPPVWSAYGANAYTPAIVAQPQPLMNTPSAPHYRPPGSTLGLS
jgi:hypothetical protein